MSPAANPESNAGDPQLHALLDQLDRLEELVEEMVDLGVSSMGEAETRIAELNAQVDELTADEG